MAVALAPHLGNGSCRFRQSEGTLRERLGWLAHTNFPSNTGLAVREAVTPLDVGSEVLGESRARASNRIKRVVNSLAHTLASPFPIPPEHPGLSPKSGIGSDEVLDLLLLGFQGLNLAQIVVFLRLSDFTIDLGEPTFIFLESFHVRALLKPRSLL